MHGIGNDFVMIDAISGKFTEVDWPALAPVLCDRKLGVGSDGLIVMSKGERAPLRMAMFNPDGSESEMCGNGIRCLAVLAHHNGHIADRAFDCETRAGLLSLELISDSSVRVGMGTVRFDVASLRTHADQPELVDFPLRLEGETIVGTAVSVGNPHFVSFVERGAESMVQEYGPRIENHKIFLNRINAHFVEVLSRSEIVQRTWERGAGATQACGTGACASVAAGVRTGRLDRKVTVRLPGGSLDIEYDEAGHLWMTGPAEIVFVGEFFPTPPAE